MKLLDSAKTLFKALKERKGFTLPEVAAVVAITGTLAAIVVPVAVDQIEKGRQARAAMDVDGI
ncbi:MAG: prepilin-type N-terminal cleavage/methylation domain-containing protein, partial [Planctomycetes bacterium]|nr:prepilin-type N-terminal cleavage/methylation domain-containing protein [Planctomycetota bacterium]